MHREDEQTGEFLASFHVSHFAWRVLARRQKARSSRRHVPSVPCELRLDGKRTWRAGGSGGEELAGEDGYGAGGGD